MKKTRKSEAKRKPAGVAEEIGARGLDKAAVRRLCAGTPLGWYVAVTETGRDLTAEQALLDLGFDVYLPRETSWRRSPTSKRKIHLPLFPGYIFVCSGRRDAGEVDDVWYAHGPDLDVAWLAKGVAGVLVSGGKPWPVRAGLVDALRAAEAAGEFDRTARARKTWTPGQKVRITGGKFVGFVGEIASAADAQDRVKVLLEGVFKGGVPVSLDKIEAA